ncbi:hypothetical protein H6503_04465 [Candidatus Woesearchaeota archaeon]|nr:hypothetical protein [Candidatus Woesearchaeota archaeon]
MPKIKPCEVKKYLFEEAEKIAASYGYSVAERLPAFSNAAYRIEKGSSSAVLKLMHSDVRAVCLEGVLQPFMTHSYLRALDIEAQVFKELSGTPGLPELYESIVPSSFVRKVNKYSLLKENIKGYIIREYIEGVALGRWIKNGIIQSLYVKDNPAQLYGVVDAVHSIIADLDLVSPNIVISDQGPYLIDFVKATTVRKCLTIPSSYNMLKIKDIRQIEHMVDNHSIV